jgi:hypothetical protein
VVWNEMSLHGDDAGNWPNTQLKPADRATTVVSGREAVSNTPHRPHQCWKRRVGTKQMNRALLRFRKQEMVIAGNCEVTSIRHPRNLRSFWYWQSKAKHQANSEDGCPLRWQEAGAQLRREDRIGCRSHNYRAGHDYFRQKDKQRDNSVSNKACIWLGGKNGS